MTVYILLRFSRHRPIHDDGSDRAGTDDRTAAWRAGMDRALERQLGRRLAPGEPSPKPRMDGDTKRQPPLL